MTERTSSAQTPLYLLLAVLILGGVGWWLWPGADDEAEFADATAEREADGSELQMNERRKARRDLATQAKASASGTVRVFGGGPLAEAQVCATPSRGELRGLGDGKPQCTRTGPDGHWHLDGLWPVRTMFDASAVGHEPRGWRIKDERGRWQGHTTLVPDEETKNIDFDLKPGGVRLAGVIKDLGGGEIEGARVWAGEGDWSISERGTSVTISDAEGRFELWVADGMTSVSANAEGYGSASMQVHAPSERVELFLTPESVLVGQVVHAETGEPIADAVVQPRANYWGGTGSDTVRSDAEGRFRIGGLRPGVYKPSATRDDVHGQAAMQVHLGLGQTSESVEIRVHPMAMVEGRVLVAGTESGCPAGNVSLVRSDDPRDRAWGQTDDEGRVVLRALRPGTYRAEVSCEGMIAGDDYPELTVAGADRLEQVWEVREGQAIRGQVVDSEGKGVAEANVNARAIVDAESARAQTTNAWGSESEADGNFELTGLLPGRYEVSVWSEQPSSDTPLVVELPVGSDRNDLRIELLPSGTITGRVVDEHGTPQPAVRVEAKPPGKWRSSSTLTDDQGNFRLEHVRTGENRVLANDQPWGDSSLRAPGTTDDDVQGERVEVLAGQTVEVELRIESRTGVIRGKVVDENGGPVDDAFIHAERMSDSATANAQQSKASVRWGGWNTTPILSDVDGSFTIDELAEGSYVVRAYRRGGGEAITEGVALGSTIELTIEATGVLAGTVGVSGGQPPEKFSISAVDKAQSLFFSDDFLRTEGKWQLSELPAGKYEINVECNLGTAKVETELEAGGRVENLELALTPRVTLRGRVVDLDTGAPIPGLEVNVQARGSSRFMLMGEEGGERKHVSDAEGRFEIERAPAGKVDILVLPRGFGGGTSDYGWGSFSRSIAEQPAVQDIGDLEMIAKRLEPEQAAGDLGFELKQQAPDVEREDIVHVVGLIRPGGPASATALAVGDEIETVDGKSVTGNDNSRYFMLTQVPAGTVIELGLAGGKSVTITAAPPIR
jgi:protocatechuate 3,4-dioxygenase beta subunit